MAFFITTPRKPSLGELLGKGIGTGLSEGTKSVLSAYLGGVRQQQKLSQALGKQRQQAQAGFGKYASDIIGKDIWQEIEPERKLEYQSLVGKMFDEYKDPILAQRGAIDALLRRERPTDEEIEEPPKEGLFAGIKELPKEFYKGAKLSVAGKLAKLITEGGYDPEQLAQEAATNPTFAAHLARTIGAGVADLPLYFAGAAIAGPAGMIALPTLAGSLIDEVARALSSKEKMTLAKGGEGALKVIEKTTKAALTGAILGKIPGMTKFLKKTPGVQNLLKNYVAEKLIETGAATAALATIDPILEGRKPTGKDFANSLTNVMAFEIINLPGASKKFISNKLNRIKDSVKNPTEFANQVKEKFSELGGSEKALNAGKPGQIKILNKSLNEIQKRVEVVKKRAIKEKIPTVKEKETLEKRIAQKKEIAKILKEKPIEEFLKPKELPKGEQKLIVERNTLRADVEKTQRQLDQVQEVKARPGKPAKNVEIAERALTSHLERQKTELKEISNRLAEDRGKRMAQIEKRRMATEAQDLQKTISEHMQKLNRISKNPESLESKELEEMFNKDQKHIDEADKLMKTGKLPDKAVTDTGIKILEQYNKAYSNMLEKVNQFLEKTKKERNPETLKRRKNAAELKRRLDRNKKINDSKLIQRKQKRFTKEALRGPGKTFMKKYLKDLGLQSKILEKDIFKYKEKFGDLEKRIEDIKDTTLLRNAIKSRNAEQITKETGIEKNEVEKYLNEGKKVAKESAEKIKKGESIDKSLSSIRKMLEKYSKLPRITRALISGIIFEELQDAIQAVTGIKPSVSFLSIALPKKLAGLRFGAYVTANLYRQTKKAIKKEIYKNQYEKLNTSWERAMFLRKLRKEGVGTKVLKEIRGK